MKPSIVGRALALVETALLVILVLVGEAMLVGVMAGLSMPFAAVFFDLVGWEYGAAHAFTVTAVAVVLLGIAVIFVGWLVIHAHRLSYTQMLACGLEELISQDDYGKLWRIRSLQDEEPVLVVEVVNMTPETDGSYRRYVLRVPAEMRTPRQAIAWTFGFPNADAYILDAAS